MGRRVIRVEANPDAVATGEAEAVVSVTGGAHTKLVTVIFRDQE